MPSLNPVLLPLPALYLTRQARKSAALPVNARYVVIWLGLGRNYWGNFLRNHQLSARRPHALDNWSQREIKSYFQHNRILQKKPAFNHSPLYFINPNDKIYPARLLQNSAITAKPTKLGQYLPLQTWLREFGFFPSPLGIFIHAKFGLWTSIRGVTIHRKNPRFTDTRFRFARLNQPESLYPKTISLKTIHPCEVCLEKPCISACPVSAVSNRGFDYQTCQAHLVEKHNNCIRSGCLSRLACPLPTLINAVTGQVVSFNNRYQYQIGQSLYFLRKYLKNLSNAND